ncbi:hypothetical protein [Rhodopila sp.]|uniref:hypothetical protein n=1 Tax=Rhodopila sp. TaxID=2480087 RepID=UPI003D0E78AE
MEPTKTVLAAAGAPISTTDKQGRHFLIRRPTALDTLRLFKVAGPTLAQNEPWLAMASLAFAVQEIDGIPIPSPVSENQIELLVDRLGENALTVIAEAINIADDETDMKAQVGNLPGTPS